MYNLTSKAGQLEENPEELEQLLGIAEEGGRRDEDSTRNVVKKERKE